jgi:hypothetical protein
MQEEEVPTVQAHNPHIGWTEELYFMDPDPNAFFHDLLVKTLQEYYSDLQATLEYRNNEAQAPSEELILGNRAMGQVSRWRQECSQAGVNSHCSSGSGYRREEYGGCYLQCTPLLPRMTL